MSKDQTKTSSAKIPTNKPKKWFANKVANLSVVAGLLLIATGSAFLYFNNIPRDSAKAATPFDSITASDIVVNAVVGQAIGSVSISNLPSTITGCNLIRGNASDMTATTGLTPTGAGAKTCTTTLTETVSSLDFIPITVGVNTGEKRTFQIKPVLPSTVGTQNQTTDANYQFNKSTISFLKADNSTALNGVLHKDWRTGVSSGTSNADMKIVVTGFQIAQNLLDAETYTCNISARPAGSTGAYLALAYDANANGTIDSGETTNNIPYSSANGCTALFTNANRVGGGGQNVITGSLSSTYQWDVKVDMKDSANNIIDTRNTFYEFKFAAIIPGG